MIIITKKIQVSLPNKLASEVEKLLTEEEYESVSEFGRYVIQEYVMRKKYGLIDDVSFHREKQENAADLSEAGRLPSMISANRMKNNAQTPQPTHLGEGFDQLIKISA